MFSEITKKMDIEISKTFAKITEDTKKRLPDHDMWKNSDLKSFRFKDVTATTINGHIVAIVPNN